MEQDLAQALVEERGHVVGVEDLQDDTQAGRQRKEDESRESPMRRVDPHLPQNLESLTYNMGRGFPESLKGCRPSPAESGPR